MRNTEKAVAVILLATVAWAVIMTAGTSFQGAAANRILLMELGGDAATLNQAVQGDGTKDRDAVAHNIQMMVRNTYMDFFFVLLYWLTFLSLAVLAGRMGKRLLAACAAVLISGAAVSDLLENGAILSAMRVWPFTDQVAVDITEFSQWKWVFFFLAALLLGLAIAMNHHVSTMRRASGRIFIVAGVLGILGISQYRVSLDFAIWMLNLGVLLIAVALLLTLWKIYQSLRDLGHIGHGQHAHLHA